MRPYEYFDNVYMSIAYEFDLNQYRIDREAYNLLDWLGDVGGLTEALKLISLGLLSIINYSAFDLFMVQRILSRS